MSTSKRSDAVHSPNSWNSSYGMGLGDSDDEGSWTEGECGDMGTIDYWFGRKYFECVIAQHLVRQETLWGDVADIDVGHIFLAKLLKLTGEVSTGSYATTISTSGCNGSTVQRR
jgi:hypothetical protein